MQDDAASGLGTPKAAPFRRRVFYIPGYDPIPPRRYRELYRREGEKQALISGYGLKLGPRRDRTGFGWGVRGDFNGQTTDTEFEVLIWADLVQGSMGRSIPATYGQMLRTGWIYIASGVLRSLMRLRRGPVIAALYPVVVLIGQFLVSLLLSVLAGALTGWAVAQIGPAPSWLAILCALPVSVVVFVALLRLWQRLDGRIFAYYLMHDYAFTAQHHGAYPPVLRARIKQFSDRIAQALKQDWDEVLVVGHSSGAYLAVSVLADLLRSGEDLPENTALGLLTLGQVVPMASFLPKAYELRRDLQELSVSPKIDWIDVSAPGDACSFGLCDPVAVSGVAPPDQRWPLVISAAFTHTLSETQQQSLKYRWFKLHFQYLCAFERVGDYDYFAITAGAMPLGQRFSGRSHSPGRIARPVNRHRDLAP